MLAWQWGAGEALWPSAGSAGLLYGESRSESTRRYHEAEVPSCRDKKGDPGVAFSYAAILLLTQSTMAAIQPKMMSGML
ncbi:hypothetical protein D3C72_1789440 [compost metagenome]